MTLQGHSIQVLEALYWRVIRTVAKYPHPSSGLYMCRHRHLEKLIAGYTKMSSGRSMLVQE